MCSEWRSAIVRAGWSRKTHMYRVWFHSPDYVFTVLVSIFMKTHNHFWAPPQCYKDMFTAIYSKSDGVLCFHYSHMRIANDMYQYVPRTYERTYASSTMSRPSGAETKMGDVWWETTVYVHADCYHSLWRIFSVTVLVHLMSMSTAA